jgi:hypothetical protein
MSESTELASGHITRAHELRVVLQEPADNPPLILIEWPDKPTVCTPHGRLRSLQRCDHWRYPGTSVQRFRGTH